MVSIKYIIDGATGNEFQSNYYNYSQTKKLEKNRFKIGYYTAKDPSNYLEKISSEYANQLISSYSGNVKLRGLFSDLMKTPLNREECFREYMGDFRPLLSDESTSPNFKRDQALKSACKIFIMQSKYEMALNVLNNIVDPSIKDKVIKFFFKDLIKMQKYDDDGVILMLTKTQSSVEKKNKKFIVLENFLSLAETISKQLSIENDQENALKLICKKWAACGQIDRAHTVCQSISNPLIKDEALHLIVRENAESRRGLANSTCLHQSLDFVKEISNLNIKDLAFSDICKFLTQRGDLYNFGTVDTLGDVIASISNLRIRKMTIEIVTYNLRSSRFNSTCLTQFKNMLRESGLVEEEKKVISPKLSLRKKMSSHPKAISAPTMDSSSCVIFSPVSAVKSLFSKRIAKTLPQQSIGKINLKNRIFSYSKSILLDSVNFLAAILAKSMVLTRQIFRKFILLNSLSNSQKNVI